MANDWATPPEAVWVWGKYGKYEDTYCDAEEIKQEEFAIPVTKYIRADLATLSSDAARDALTELDQLRDRVKELEADRDNIETLLLAAEHGRSADEVIANYRLIRRAVQNAHAARRVREGGKV